MAEERALFLAWLGVLSQRGVGEQSLEILQGLLTLYPRRVPICIYIYIYIFRVIPSLFCTNTFAPVPWALPLEEFPLLELEAQRCRAFSPYRAIELVRGPSPCRRSILPKPQGPGAFDFGPTIIKVGDLTL